MGSRIKHVLEKWGGDLPSTQRRKEGGNVESDMWISGAIKHPGALHQQLNVPKDQKIPEAKLERAEHSKNQTLRKRAVLAETLKGFHKR